MRDNDTRHPRHHRSVHRRLGRGGAFGLALALLALTAPAAAAPVATIEAVASAPLPPATAVAVVAGEPGERTALLLPVVAEALASRGYAVAATAALQLRVSATVAGLAGDRRPFRLYGTVGSASRPDVTLEVPLPEWPGPRQDDAFYRYSITMVLGAPGRPAVWQGSAAALRPTADDLAAEQRMAAALAGKLGLSARAEPVPLE